MIRNRRKFPLDDSQMMHYTRDRIRDCIQHRVQRIVLRLPLPRQPQNRFVSAGDGIIDNIAVAPQSVVPARPRQALFNVSILTRASGESRGGSVASVST
jgi:hypothetical protein